MLFKKIKKNQTRTIFVQDIHICHDLMQTWKNASFLSCLTAVTADIDQTASVRAIWSGSVLFIAKIHLNFYNKKNNTYGQYPELSDI